MEFAYICKANYKDGDSNTDQQTSCHTLLEILSFATSHYATNMQLNVYNMDTCHKNNGLNLYKLKLLYLIYLHRLYIIVYVPLVLRLTAR